MPSTTIEMVFFYFAHPRLPGPAPASYRRKDLGLGNYKGAEAVREAVGG